MAALSRCELAMNSDLQEGMAGTGAIDDVVGVPFGPLNNPLLIDGPRPRKTLFFSNIDDDGPNYSSDNSENDDTAMSARHDRTSGDICFWIRRIVQENVNYVHVHIVVK